MRFVRSAIFPLVVLWFTAATACTSDEAPRPGSRRLTFPAKLLVQPYKGVADADVEVVKRAVEQMYCFEIEVLPERDLPAAAYFPPRRRYRAAALLTDLEERGSETSKIIGLTSRDISVTHEGTDDWGIFGLGTVSGKPSVVSGYRLRRDNVGRALYEARLGKVANHEIGHTLGLGHCDQDGCLMRDAGGKIATIDKVTGRLCSRCAAALAPLAVLRAK